jgi:hypothetical protein
MGTQALVNRLGEGARWVLLKVDLKNAFNTLSREQLLEETHTRCPALYNFMRFAYSHHVPLFCGGRMLHSQKGVHQGCPLGPVGFALGIQPFLEELSRTAGLNWNCWYLDDGALLGNPVHVTTAFRILAARFAGTGLTVNEHSCLMPG